MSRNHGKNPKVELKLNLSGKQVRARGGPSTRAVVVSEDEDDSSSSPSEQKQADSPEATSSMVLAGCPRCLMYVMLSEKDPKCPKCKSTVLVDFHGGSTSSRRSRRS
ncbi:hypothetical protein BHE74_00047411 [Ensete ventricosum]|nr:hypothetical protein BHE74_00047411 [Ensete ventricosum]RZS01875.1 hypothetical protein BHM03_00031816 [Ensete ventricosum]